MIEILGGFIRFVAVGIPADPFHSSSGGFIVFLGRICFSFVITGPPPEVLKVPLTRRAHA